MKSTKDWRPLSLVVWHHLIDQRDNERLFFRDVAREVGISPRHLNYPLAYIMEFCERHALPPLTGIILNKHEYARQKRCRPSAHFRLKHQGRFIFPSDAQFYALYQQQVKAVRAMDWQRIDYQPAPLTTFALKQHLMEAKQQRERGGEKAISLTQLARGRG